jgi:hypothetical protein
MVKNGQIFFIIAKKSVYSGPKFVKDKYNFLNFLAKNFGGGCWQGFRYLLQWFTVTPSRVQVASGTETLEIAFTFQLICSSYFCLSHLQSKLALVGTSYKLVRVGGEWDISEER